MVEIDWSQMKKNLLKVAAVALTSATVVLGTASVVFADTGAGTNP